MPRSQVRSFGTALKSNAATNRVINTTSPSGFDAAHTVATWVKLSDITTTQRIMMMGAGGTSRSGLSIFNGFIRAGYYNGSAYITPQSINLVKRGEWCHIALVWNGTASKFFFNGVNYTANNSPNTAVIGGVAASDATQGLVAGGILDESLAWTRALSDTEISDLYHNGTVPSTGLHLHWKYDEGSGTSATDSSGNGNTGTITGATYTSDVPMVARPSAANRVAVRDFKASLNNSATTQRVLVKSDRLVSTLANVTFAGWIKVGGAGGANGYAIYSERAATGTNIWKVELQSASYKLRLTYRNDANVLSQPTALTNLNNKQWVHIAVVKAGTAISFYVNGASDGTGAISSLGTLTNTGTSSVIGNDIFDIGNNWFNGLMAGIQLYPTALTATEIQNLYNSGINPYSTSGEWLFNEGAGTTANDSSGNANHGTITGATFSADVPMKARQEVNSNLVKNGNFEYAPPFVAATTSGLRWVDGSAAGSSINDLFGWALSNFAASTSSQFDSSVKYSGGNSIKLSTLDATGRARLLQTPTNNYSTINTTPQHIKYLVPVLPNTSYTISGYIKTNNVIAAGIQVVQMQGDGTLIGSNATANSAGTSDWTLRSLVFTTSATCRYIGVQLNNDSAGNISDAWFDDIVLKPTTPVTRSVVV